MVACLSPLSIAAFSSFGIVSLCAHTIAYNIVPLVFMLPLGILIGLTVRMGHLISEYPSHAKRLAAWCMLFTTLGLGTTVVGIMYLFRLSIIASFTDDDEVVRVALALWPHLCAYLWLLHVFGISQAILRALGMQWRLALITSTFLCLVTLPLVVYFSMVRGGGLVMLWTVFPICYAVMQAILAAGYLTVNWEEYSAGLLESLQMSHSSIRGFPVGVPTEETALLAYT